MLDIYRFFQALSDLGCSQLYRVTSPRRAPSFHAAFAQVELPISDYKMIMATGIRRLALRFTAPAAGLAAMIVLAILYHFEPQFYHRLLAFIGINAFRYPFLDFQYILAGVDCWQRGIDVYVTNPCDVLNREFAYPPVWLRFAFLPGKEWTNVFALCLATSFFLALAVLPPPRSGKELLPRLVATLSPVTTFAVERANIDLLAFLIATAAGVLMLGPLRRRVAAYAMIVIAGLLKIYPLVLMVLTLRERPRVFLWVNGAAVAVVLATGIYFHAEVVKMVPNIPRHEPGDNSFAAHYLPDVIAMKLDTTVHPGLAVLRLMRLTMLVALILAIAGWFFHLVRWRDFRQALARLPESEKMFLLIGAALISGCFFAGTSVGYRGIYLLFTLPGILAMARMEGDMGVRRAAMQGCVLVMALTWAGFFTWPQGRFEPILASWMGQAPAAAVVQFLWLLSEIAWWQVAMLFVAILIGCCCNWFEEVPEWRRLRPMVLD